MTYTDLHKSTAARMFGVSYEEVTPKQRKVAKRRNFLALYGAEETPEQQRATDRLWVALGDVL